MYRVWDDRYIKQSNSGQFLLSGVSGQFLPTGSSGSFYLNSNPNKFVQSGQINDSSNLSSLNTNTRLLSDDAGNSSLDWNNKQLIVTDEVRLDWNNFILNAAGGGSTLYWNTKQLSGTWNAQSLFISGQPVATQSSGLTYLIYNKDTNGPLYRLSSSLSGGKDMGSALISSNTIAPFSKLIIESEVRSAVITTSSSTSSARVGFTWHLGWWTGTNYFYKDFNHEIGRIAMVGFTGGAQYEYTLKTTSSGILPTSGTTVDIRAQCDNSHVNNEMQVKSLRVYGVV